MKIQSPPLLLICTFLSHTLAQTKLAADLICDLQCNNNGFCRFITEDSYQLQKRIQSGHMVHECICPMGFRGMSCDVNEDEHPSCETENTDEHGRSACDCVVADRMSTFAGSQCRKPFTEYGATLENTRGGHISYCTNGGKLKADLMAAQVSPGNTSSNFLFQHAGCFCPPEFAGEHCEILDNEHYQSQQNQQSQHQNTAAQESNPESDDSGGFLVPVLMILVGILLMLGNAYICRLLSRRRRAQESDGIFQMQTTTHELSHHHTTSCNHNQDPSVYRDVEEEPNNDDDEASFFDEDNGDDDEEFKDVPLLPDMA